MQKSKDIQKETKDKRIISITYQKNLHRPAAKGFISRWIVSLIRIVYENSTELL